MSRTRSTHFEDDGVKLLLNQPTICNYFVCSLVDRFLSSVLLENDDNRFTWDKLSGCIPQGDTHPVSKT